MHQSPQKHFGGSRREKYSLWDLADGESDRRSQRGSPPKARKYHLREDGPREERGGRQHAR
ncbi:MAG TPA: hypothetical protein VEA40_13595 [Ramlibacter sp.]|nr:hypothetical protein [Ramlibacter sp.]